MAARLSEPVADVAVAAEKLRAEDQLLASPEMLLADVAALLNAAWLCGYHHWLVHEGGWSLQRQQFDGRYLWTGPHGQQRIRTLGPPRHP